MGTCFATFCRMFNLTRKRKIILTVVAGLLVIRAILPTGLTWYANKLLADSPDYRGHVEDIDLALWRGGFRAESVEIIKNDPKSIPIVEISDLEVSIFWPALLTGRVLSEVRINQPVFQIYDYSTPGSTKGKPLEPQLRSGVVTLKSLLPFRIQHLTVVNGSIYFRNEALQPPLEAGVSGMEASIRNINNYEDRKEPLYATAKITGETTGKGKLEMGLLFDPLNERPTFDLNLSTTGVELKALNSIFKSYGGVDFYRGTADLIVEVAAENGRFKGYVKPLLKNVEVFNAKQDIKKDKDGIFKIFWEAIVGTVEELLENQPKDQFATKIPIQGRLDAPGIDLFDAVNAVFRNAFVQAFMPWFDESVDIKSYRRKPGVK